MRIFSYWRFKCKLYFDLKKTNPYLENYFHRCCIMKGCVSDCHHLVH